MSWKSLRALALTACILLSTSPVRAELITLEMHFSGEGVGNDVHADGRITFDMPIYAEGGFSVSTTDIKDFYMVISGSRSDDGVYTKAIQQWWYGDYPGLVNFRSPVKLDFTKELIDQPLSNGDHFFNEYEYDTSDGNVHNGAFYLNGPLKVFNMYYQQTWHGNSAPHPYETIRLVSLRAVGYVPPAPVPEPTTYAMMLAGIGLVTVTARRRRAQPGQQIVGALRANRPRRVARRCRIFS